jgi:hypothetical protein
MEISVHIRYSGQLDQLDRIPEQILDLYVGLDLEEQDWAGSIPDQVRRIYVGDEFCVHRLPDLARLEDVCSVAAEKGLDVTLLSPPVTDDGLERCTPLLRFLEKEAPGSEVVVNDWGLLHLLDEKHPSLSVAAGRLLNKGFKDPRLADADRVAQISEDAEELLKGCTFDSPKFQDKIRDFRVRRLERDLLPFGDPRMGNLNGFETSVYFPFGYVSTGRVCWIASFKGPAGRKFSPLEACCGPCDGLLLELGGPDLGFRLFQGGNAVFYLYPLSVLGSLLGDRNHEGVRLVYQGLAI